MNIITKMTVFKDMILLTFSFLFWVPA